MKHIIFTLLLAVVAISATADEVMTKQGDTYIVNTTTICKTKGFKSTTPLEVYIQKGRILKIVPLKNMESKGYFARVQKFVLTKYESLEVSKAKKLSAKPEVDGCTGATYSTTAVQDNIHEAIRYYEKNK